MPLTIHRIIVHYLDKQERTTDADIDYSSEMLTIDDFATKLTDELHNSISANSSIKNAAFKEDETNSFTIRLNDYLEDATDDKFVLFSKSLDLLKTKVEKQSLAKGGYYLFSDYTINDSRYVAVVLLRKKSGINIIKEGSEYKLDGAENINIDKIAMAARLNYDIFNAIGDDRKYLAIITTQSDGEVSEYFKEWVLAAGMIKNTVNTDRLMKIIKTIDLPNDEEGNEISRSDFQRAVYEYARTNNRRRVNIYNMSEHFFGSDAKTAIKDFADANDIVLDPEFRVGGKWKNLITIKVSVPGIILNVDFDKINENDVDVQEDQIIIRSPELAALLTRRYNNATALDEQ
ncbi:nucleoid-associated protein [Gillisia sp. JM1]|uniref:nucleoid-associated protein n=1 Tax=Gillisia sp. JM1 TaxID=1283286 RepID=UPI00047ADC39|nr:nucleoid-associated protein [Gillisia sp. JM1]